MKKIFLAITILSVLLNACTKDLEQLPITDKELSKFLTSEVEVEEYVISTYASLQNNGLYGLYLPAMGEIPSDNTLDEVPANDGAIYGDLDEFKTIAQNGMIADNWRASYVTIQRCNVVLNRISSVAFRAANTKNSRIGEMKFIRALIYFNLVQFYGDVPLTTEETTDPNFYFGKGRQPIADVYNQITKDLTEAIQVLPSTTIQAGRVIKTAAQALLGKVLLTQKKYADAKIQLDAVVASNAHLLLPSVADIFSLANENNREIIFAVQFASGVNSNTEGSIMFREFSPTGVIAGAKGHNLPTRELYNLYSIIDSRRGNYVGLTTGNVPFNNKLKRPTVPADGGNDVVALRFADVILMQAEVENELGNTTVAQTALNRIRNRANLANTTAATQAQLRDAIELERRLELVGEGYRWLDLLRTGKAIATMNAWFSSQSRPITVTPKFLLLPIPQNQIDTDPTIKQNAGYN
jgi:starch-binding outer membrane protein, SusD/RagB family